jgi:hypothetical protein
MVINVEMIGHSLLIQRYVVETATTTSCKLVSVSEAFTPNGRTHVQVVRALNVKKVDENTCELVSTAQFMDFIAQHKIKFEAAVGARQHVEGEHNRREAPLMAASIERMAQGQGQQGGRSVGAV